MFHDGDLQSGIGLAVQQSKAVLCFVRDDTETSTEWEATLWEEKICSAVTSQTIALRIPAGSQEAGFLTPICAINSTPAIVVIKNGQVQTNLQSSEVPVVQLRSRLSSAFGVQEDQGTEEQEEIEPSSSTESADVGPEYLDLQAQPGQMRLPNNAYDALRNYTQKLLEEGKSHTEVLDIQLTLLNNIPIFKDEVSRLRAEKSKRELSEYAISRLLRLPAVGLKIPGHTQTTAAAASLARSTAPSNPPAPVTGGPPVYTSQNRTPSSIPQPRSQVPSAPAPSTSQPKQEDEKQKAQRQEYIRMQRDRENAARAERERIKAQIKADREERRRIDELRKQGQQPTELESESSSTYARAGSRANASADVRIQVRTFDGSTLRKTFPVSSSIGDKLRPWIDGATDANMPYNLKLILTPLPNRTIEAGEEDTSLSDLGIVGSCTLVMVPVKGYVESYSAARGGLMGQNGLLGGVGGMVSGGYNLVSGTAGWALGGVKSVLGYGEQAENTLGTSQGSGTAASESAGPPKNVRIRTLADQRAEEAKKDQQFYNGNQLNFEPNKDDDGKKD